MELEQYLSEQLRKEKLAKFELRAKREEFVVYKPKKKSILRTILAFFSREKQHTQVLKRYQKTIR
ncbi:hypothetical protein I6N90_01320 [Paenibacillus sp. GSMTC-2017]|uniref:hypothetical protein n=1 Tax=Paenibacillus sp. GSMTC-2017 TaxID=2794350 RepID=UPI0018D8558F|nr:hypothetical protein [Paenibacillus sp. GSMTC-2017]MBH5316444.1 hypothetical protein [Paenibacillus sp. GSMTC-2017]